MPIGYHIHSHSSDFALHLALHIASRIALQFALHFGTGGGVDVCARARVPSQTQKRVILALFQVLDPPHVFITVLHKSTIGVKCLLCSPYFISRIGRAGWISTTQFFYDRQKSRSTRRRQFDLQATS